MTKLNLVDERARDHTLSAEARLRELFPTLIENTAIDARFVDASRHAVIGVAGLPAAAPVVGRLLGDRDIFAFLSQLWRDGSSLLVRLEGEDVAVYVAKDGSNSNSTSQETGQRHRPAAGGQA